MSERRLPMDFAAIAKESGMTRGKVCRSLIAGWCVQNDSVNPDWPNIACITPPEFQDGETQLKIEGKEWVFT